MMRQGDKGGKNRKRKNMMCVSVNSGRDLN